MLELRGVTKAFPGVVANDGISLEIADGQVHAILGENGAGKSTLTKIIYGFYQPDSGSICFNGREVRFRSPVDSRRMGIGMVFQDFSLIPSMSVLDNVALFMPDQPVLLRRAELRRRIVDLSERYGLRIDPGLTVAQLSMGERQKVELIKLLVAGADLLIFDEPTSVLAPQEVDNLFRIFEELTTQGHGVVFITHKVREAVAAAHVVTVLRQGKIAGSVSTPALDESSLVSLMLGSVTPVPLLRNRTPPAPGDLALEFEQVWSTDAAAGRGLRGVDFRAYAGEILGVAGVAGNGQQELGGNAAWVGTLSWPHPPVRGGYRRLVASRSSERGRRVYTGRCHGHGSGARHERRRKPCFGGPETFWPLLDGLGPDSDLVGPREVRVTGTQHPRPCQSGTSLRRQRPKGAAGTGNGPKSNGPVGLLSGKGLGRGHCDAGPAAPAGAARCRRNGGAGVGRPG